MHPQKVSQEAINLVKVFEGLHKVGSDGLIHAYFCPAGKWTLGFGATKGVRSGMTCTKDDAEKRLMEDLEEHGAIVKRSVNVPLTQHQYDALTSFVFNLGGGAFRSSTLLKVLNQGKYDDVPAQLMRWNKAKVDGKTVPLNGLTRRRTAEAALFSLDAQLPSQEGGAKMAQKPTAEAPKPLTKSRTMQGAGIAGAATALGEIAPQIEALVPYSDNLKTLFLICTIGGVALAAYARWSDHQKGER
jgi:lysozyme